MDLFLLFLEWFVLPFSSPKKVLVLIGAFVLFFVGAFAVYAGGAAYDDPASNLLLIVGFTLIAVALGLVAYVIVSSWRDAIQHRRGRSKQLQNPRAAITELRASGNLAAKDSPLIGANWTQVDLHGVDLSGANLKMIGLEQADLSDATLRNANLRSARLDGANLKSSDLTRAALTYARLQHADLREAQLIDADLCAADFSGARLDGAAVRGVRCDEHTRLPDGSLWTSSADWRRFTD